MRLPKLLLPVLLIGALGTPVLAQNILDNFTEGQNWSLGRDPAVYGLDPLDFPLWVPVAIPGSATVTDLGNSSIAGGQREITFSKQAGAGWSPTVDQWIVAEGGGISFNSSWDQGQASWTLAYGTASALDMDFGSCGNDRIRLQMSGQIDVDNSGDANGPFGHDATPCTLTIWSNGQSESVTKDLFSEPSVGQWGDQNYYPGGGDINHDFLLSEFSTTDFAHVEQIIFKFDYILNQNTAVDYSIRTIVLPQACSNDQTAEVLDQPGQFQLVSNFPNPFNPATTIEFTLAETADVNLSVFDMLGNKVATLADGLSASGSHQVQFDATGLASGVYYYTLTANNTSATRKMLLLK